MQQGSKEYNFWTRYIDLTAGLGDFMSGRGGVPPNYMLVDIAFGRTTEVSGGGYATAFWDFADTGDGVVPREQKSLSLLAGKLRYLIEKGCFTDRPEVEESAKSLVGEINRYIDDNYGIGSIEATVVDEPCDSPKSAVL